MYRRLRKRPGMSPEEMAAAACENGRVDSRPRDTGTRRFTFRPYPFPYGVGLYAALSVAWFIGATVTVEGYWDAWQVGMAVGWALVMSLLFFRRSYFAWAVLVGFEFIGLTEWIATSRFWPLFVVQVALLTVLLAPAVSGHVFRRATEPARPPGRSEWVILVVGVAVFGIIGVVQVLDRESGAVAAFVCAFFIATGIPRVWAVRQARKR